jgi:hypothetical protein
VVAWVTFENMDEIDHNRKTNICKMDERNDKLYPTWVNLCWQNLSPNHHNGGQPTLKQ